MPYGRLLLAPAEGWWPPAGSLQPPEGPFGPSLKWMGSFWTCTSTWTCNPVATWTCNLVATLTCNPVTNWTCNPVATWTCNSEATWTCNPAATWTCNPAATWTCNPGAIWTCNPSVTWTCNPAATQWWLGLATQRKCKKCDGEGGGEEEDQLRIGDLIIILFASLQGLLFIASEEEIDISIY